MAREYYFDYVSVPGIFKNHVVEEQTTGKFLLQCTEKVLREYGVPVEMASQYNEIYTGDNRYRGHVSFFDKHHKLINVSVGLSKEDKLFVDFTLDPLLETNSNDEIIADIKAAAIEVYLLNKDSQIHVTDKAPEKQSGDGCYIATAIYGSYDCPEVWVLRRFRDYSLAQNLPGRMFIRVYYTISPCLVRLFGDTEWFKHFWKSKLDFLIKCLKSKGFKDSPYNDNDFL